MKPNTAESLKERKSNRLKDFLQVAGPLKVSHLISFSQSESFTQMRAIKLPRGPSLTFRVEEYVLKKDVHKMFKRPEDHHKSLLTPPLLVLNNFPKNENHTKLTSMFFRHMFPAIDPSTVRLSECRRVVLVNYNQSDESVDFRHYFIKASPVGVNRRIKKVVKARIP